MQHESRVHVAHRRLYVPRNQKPKGRTTDETPIDNCAGLLIGAAAVQYSNVASSQEGWVTLMDSTKMGDWSEVGKANWAMKDGVLTVDKLDGNELLYLVSKNSYKDFQIKAEFWADDDVNSGIFIRCKDPGEIMLKLCYEVNIFDKRPDPSYGTGAIVDVAKVDPMPKAGGKWNTYEVTAQGNPSRRRAEWPEDRRRTGYKAFGRTVRAAIRLGRAEVAQGADQAAVDSRVPDAVRHSLCRSAEPGPYQALSSRRSRLCNA